MSELPQNNIDQPPFSDDALAALQVIRSLDDNNSTVQKYKTDPDYSDKFNAIWEEEKNLSKPVKTALFFLERNPNEKNADVRRELKKYIIKQGSVLENKNIPIATTEGVASLPKTEISSAPEIKQNVPEIKLSIPVEKGDVFKSDSNQEYTVRGFTSRGGVQFKNNKDGSNGTWGADKFNEYISNGRLVKQEVIAAPETLATPLERKTTDLPETTLTLPTGSFVIKKGDEITEQNNKDLYKLIASNIKAGVLTGEVEKFRIRGTYKTETNTVLIDIVPVYINGNNGGKITLSQERLESVPKPKHVSKDKIEADHVQIDGVTLNVGDALPQNIVDIIDQEEGAQSRAWKIDRIFYQLNKPTDLDARNGILGGMRMGLTALDGKKISVPLGGLRMKLQRQKENVTRAERAAKAAARSVTETHAAKPVQETVTIPTSITIQGITFSAESTMSPEQMAACNLVTTSKNGEPLTWTLETFKKSVKNPRNIVAKFKNNLDEESFMSVGQIEKNLAVATTDEANAESSPATEAPASAEKIVQRPMTEQERQAVHAAFFARYPFLKPHVPEAPEMVAPSEEIPAMNTLENPDAAAESALATQEESVPTELTVENTQTAPAEETPDAKPTHLVPAVKKSLEQFIDLDFIKIKGFSGDFFDKNIHPKVTAEETPELYQIIHKAMLGKNITPVLGGSMYTVQKMYKENQPDGTFTRFVEIANQRGYVRAFSEEELSAIAQQNNLDTKTMQKENQTASLSENNSSDPSAPSDPLDVFDQETRETATSENEPSLERTPLKKFTTSDLQGTVKNIFSTFNKVNEDMPISDIKVTSSEQGGMTVSLTQKIDNGILSRTSVLNASLDLVIQDGKLIPNNIRIESKDKKVSRNIDEYKNHIVDALTNLHSTLLLGNNLPIETTELALENNNLVAYEK